MQTNQFLRLLQRFGVPSGIAQQGSEPFPCNNVGGIQFQRLAVTCLGLLQTVQLLQYLRGQEKSRSLLRMQTDQFLRLLQSFSIPPCIAQQSTKHSPRDK